MLISNSGEYVKTKNCDVLRDFRAANFRLVNEEMLIWGGLIKLRHKS